MFVVPFEYAGMQEVAAPFVLGDLGCRGTEERLVDCPAPSADSASLGYDTYDTDSGVTFLQGQCEPVFVACGMAADASASSSHHAVLFAPYSPHRSAHTSVCLQCTFDTSRTESLHRCTADVSGTGPRQQATCLHGRRPGCSRSP